MSTTKVVIAALLTVVMFLIGMNVGFIMAPEKERDVCQECQVIVNDILQTSNCKNQGGTMQCVGIPVSTEPTP